MKPEEWQCPLECPYQQDDNPWQRFRNRYGLFITASLLTGLMWFTVVRINDRELTREETLFPIGGIIYALVKPKGVEDVLDRLVDRFLPKS